jgi:hypothetical protein
VEHLLIILFVLFSIVSALLGRRKRRLARQQAEKRARQPAEIEAEEEEDWPSFPMGDPFEQAPLPGPLARVDEEELENQALAAEQRAQEMEERAREIERLAAEMQSRPRAREAVQETKHLQKVSPKTGEKRWKLDAQSARQAVVYAEILGRPKSERREGI